MALRKKKSAIHIEEVIKQSELNIIDGNEVDTLLHRINFNKTHFAQLKFGYLSLIQQV